MKTMNSIRTKTAAFLKAGTFLVLTLSIAACTQYGKQSPSQFPADNTGRNLRDTTQGPPTSENQRENEADLKITQQIRQAVVADDSLSTIAKNVKIITQGTTVTLRGPVNNAQERDSIAAKAGQIAGVSRVDNQLEVKASEAMPQ